MASVMSIWPEVGHLKRLSHSFRSPVLLPIVSLNQGKTSVTRLGELLTFRRFFHNYTSSPKFWSTVLKSIDYVFVLTKNGLGDFFGRFFHKLIWPLWRKTKELHFWRETHMYVESLL
jgi:hypothetical protein